MELYAVPEDSICGWRNNEFQSVITMVDARKGIEA